MICSDLWNQYKAIYDQNRPGDIKLTQIRWFSEPGWRL